MLTPLVPALIERQVALLQAIYGLVSGSSRGDDVADGGHGAFAPSSWPAFQRNVHGAVSPAPSPLLHPLGIFVVKGS
jgi:hypothetical protein